MNALESCACWNCVEIVLWYGDNSNVVNVNFCCGESCSVVVSHKTTEDDINNVFLRTPQIIPNIMTDFASLKSHLGANYRLQLLHIPVTMIHANANGQKVTHFSAITASYIHYYHNWTKSDKFHSKNYLFPQFQKLLHVELILFAYHHNKKRSLLLLSCHPINPPHYITKGQLRYIRPAAAAAEHLSFFYCAAAALQAIVAVLNNNSNNNTKCGWMVNK